MADPPLHNLVIFGASGDLTLRYLTPAMAHLCAAGRLPNGMRILGLARDPWDTSQFRQHIAYGLEQHASRLPRGTSEAVVEMLAYRQTDVTGAQDVAAALELVQGPLAAYLALPPSLFEPTVRGLLAADLAPGCRVAIEKPFGESLASAQRLNRLLHDALPEEAVFRLDHFLGIETIQNILGLRFANRVFEPVWNALHVEQVEIIWDETLTIEGRASYDHVGALRDMVQNHLLQVLCLVAMEAPPTLEQADFRGRKVDLLRAVRRLDLDEVVRYTARGRYIAGTVEQRSVPAYADEPGVDPSRATETFAQVALFIDNWRWAGVPFVLRTGKALARKRREVIIHFKGVPHLAFAPAWDARANTLRIQLGPDRVSLGINVSTADRPITMGWVELDADLAEAPVPPYARLLLDILEGDPTLAIRDDEAEESWRIVEPVLEAWRQGMVPLQEYPAGSEGP